MYLRHIMFSCKSISVRKLMVWSAKFQSPGSITLQAQKLWCLSIKGDCGWKHLSWFKNVQFMFPLSCSIWFFYQYLCHRSTFLLHIWLYWSQDAAMLVSLKCTHLPHMPALFMMTQTQAARYSWQCSWSCFHDYQTSTYCLTNVINLLNF